MEKTKATIFAGYMARTNMGQPDDTARLARARFAYNLEHWNLNTAVEHFCQEFIENDEHYDMFMEETQGWYETLLPMSDEDFAKSWPDKSREWVTTNPKRFKQAIMIDSGASNMIPIARALHEAAQECLIESVPSQNDPAMRLIVHQMAHLCGIGSTIALTDYIKLIEGCKEKAAEYE